MRVLIVMAMEAEAQPLVARLGLRAGAQFMTASGAALPMRSWETPHHTDPTAGAASHGPDVSVITCGLDGRFGVDAIGTQSAVLAAHMGIERFAPDLVISAGTAGGFRERGARIGDVYLSEEPIVYHDRRIQIDGFDAYGIGSYPCVDTRAMAEALGLKRAIISTGNAIDLPPCDLEMMNRTGASVKEMEAAAVAWVCTLHGLPFLAVKAITDLVDGQHPTEHEFMANLRTASGRLTDALARVLQWVAARGLEARNAGEAAR